MSPSTATAEKFNILILKSNKKNQCDKMLVSIHFTKTKKSNNSIEYDSVPYFEILNFTFIETAIKKGMLNFSGIFFSLWMFNSSFVKLH